MPNRIELSICDDCMFLEETDDATSFDHHYTEPESTERLSRCEAGWRSLRAQGRVFNDASDEPQLRCTNCYHVHPKDQVTTVYNEEWGENQYVCPTCGFVDEMRERDSGHDEFSRTECDCCGSVLGGSRTRYALFPLGGDDPGHPEPGPLVPVEVAQPSG